MIGNKPTITCCINAFCIIQIYSGITSGRVLEGELLCTVILEVKLFAFAYTLFHEDFSPIYEASYTQRLQKLLHNLRSLINWREIFMRQSIGKCK